MRATRLTALPLLVAGALVAGCSANSAEPDSAPDTAPTSEVPEETTEPDDDADDATTDTANAECLHGTWEMDFSSVAGFMTEMMSATGIEADVEMSGTALATFEPDGTYRIEQTDVASRFVMVVEGSELVTASTENGTVLGSYEADATHVTIEGLDRSGVTAEVTMTVDGQAIEGADMPSPEELVPQGAGEGTSTYECTADTLHLTPDLEAADLEGLGLDVDLTSTFHRR